MNQASLGNPFSITRTRRCFFGSCLNHVGIFFFSICCAIAHSMCSSRSGCSPRQLSSAMPGSLHSGRIAPTQRRYSAASADDQYGEWPILPSPLKMARSGEQFYQRRGMQRLRGAGNHLHRLIARSVSRANQLAVIAAVYAVTDQRRNSSGIAPSSSIVEWEIQRRASHGIGLDDRAGWAR